MCFHLYIFILFFRWLGSFIYTVVHSKYCNGTVYRWKGERMSRSEKKTITVDKEDHEKIRSIALRNGMDIKDMVIFTFKKTFPGDFPEKVIA